MRRGRSLVLVSDAYWMTSHICSWLNEQRLYCRLMSAANDQLDELDKVQFISDLYQ